MPWRGVIERWVISAVDPTYMMVPRAYYTWQQAYESAERHARECGYRMQVHKRVVGTWVAG